MPSIKICCISSLAEAKMAVAAGAKILGFVGPMPSGPGIVSLKNIAEIVKGVSAKVCCCLLTSATDPTTIAGEILQTGVHMVQLVIMPDTSVYSQLRASCPDIQIIQVIHVDGIDTVNQAIEIDGLIDYILLDSGAPAENILGGTGMVHDWNVSEAIIKACKTPVFLAGGINPDNVTEAITAVRPYGIDLCTGVRSAGKLDPSKLHRLFKQIQKTTVWAG